MKFIVIEGLDGSGKSTQVRLIQEYFKTNNIKFKYLHFPVVESPVFGDMVARFLRGEFGDLNEVNPYLVALLYAGDRANAKKQIEKWQDEGYLVLVDRYVYSNIGYQCAKLSELTDKEELKKWILDVEYNYFKIPKPDLSMFLDVPFEFTKKNLTNSRDGDDRDYLKGKEDIHESSLDFQMEVKKVYLDAVAENDNFVKIDCGDGDKILPSQDILDRVTQTLKDYQII